MTHLQLVITHSDDPAARETNCRRGECHCDRPRATGLLGGQWQILPVRVPCVRGMDMLRRDEAWGALTSRAYAREICFGGTAESRPRPYCFSAALIRRTGRGACARDFSATCTAFRDSAACGTRAGTRRYNPRKRCARAPPAFRYYCRSWDIYGTVRRFILQRLFVADQWSDAGEEVKNERVERRLYIYDNNKDLSKHARITLKG